MEYFTQVDVVRRLLEAGIDVRCRNAKRGETALQIVQALPPSLHVAQEITSLIQSTSLSRVFFIIYYVRVCLVCRSWRAFEWITRSIQDCKLFYVLQF